MLSPLVHLKSSPFGYAGADMSNDSRVALVTGGAKRVGRAIVETLAASGFDILFTWLSSEAEAEDVVGAVVAGGRRALAVRADLTDLPDAADRVCRAVRAEFGRLDVLVNSASVYEESGLDATNLQQMRRLWTIHLETPLLLCQNLAPLLRQSRGRVINMVDLLAERPWPRYLVYSASKAALWNLTQGLARELAPEVTVNGIAPGVVEWPDDYPEEERGKYLKRVPLARSGSPKDVAELVRFLCTDGSYITGQIIRLDGGRSVT